MFPGPLSCWQREGLRGIVPVRIASGDSRRAILATPHSRYGFSMPKGGPTSHIYFSQRLRLHYVAWGDRDAPPLLLVHGGRDHCRNWDWVAEDLRHDYHIIAPDLRGHGDSRVVERRRLHAARLRLRHRAAAEPDEDDAGDDHRALARRFDFAELHRPVSRDGREARRHRRHGAAAAHVEDDRASSRRTNVFTSGSTVCAKWPAARRVATTSLEEAFQRMQEENPHLSADQARHLTIHGSNQNEDGTYSWKFDNYVRAFFPVGLSPHQSDELYGRITCPTLLIRGTESWASDPEKDGRAKALQKRAGREHRRRRTLGAPRPARRIPAVVRKFLAA